MRVDVCLSLSRTISVFGCRFFLIANATRKSALGKTEGHSEPCGKDERLQSHRNDCSATLSRARVCVCTSRGKAKGRKYSRTCAPTPLITFELLVLLFSFFGTLGREEGHRCRTWRKHTGETRRDAYGIPCARRE